MSLTITGIFLRTLTKIFTTYNSVSDFKFCYDDARCVGARSNWMQIATYLAEHLCNNNSNQIFPVVAVLRSLSNLSLCYGQTFSIYRSAFFNIVITRTKSISTS